MGPRFDETVRGRKFFDGQLPQLIKAIEANTAELKRANDLKEKDLEQWDKLFGTPKGEMKDENPQQGSNLPHDSKD